MNSGNIFLTLFALLLIGLKLGEVGVVAAWSWWWVLSPFWIPLAIAIPLMVLAAYMGRKG